MYPWHNQKDKVLSGTKLFLNIVGKHKAKLKDAKSRVPTSSNKIEN